MRASVSSIRRSFQGRPIKLSKQQIARCRVELRNALYIYLATKFEAVSAPKLRRELRRIGINAARLYADVTNKNWANRLDDLLSSTRVVSGERVVRGFLYRAVSPANSMTSSPKRLNDLETALAHCIDNDGGKEIVIGLETHNQTIELLSTLKDFQPSATTYWDPSLPGLVAALLPIWEEVTGSKGWARFDKEEVDWVSPLYPWLKSILDADAPTNDQLIRAVRFQKVSK